MSATHVLIALLGEVALLLWGIRMVGDGVVRAFGSRLRQVLGSGLGGAGMRGRLSAFLSGMGVTAALQSSTATAMMMTAFTAGGLVGLAPALAVMLGANVGTTLIVQLLSFDITLLYPVLIFGGYILHRRARTGPSRDSARIVIGLGLTLLSLHLIVDTMDPLEASPILREILAGIADEPLIAVLIAAVFAWAAHSSIAAMLFIGSLSGAGVIAPGTALALVIGANLGSAVNPLTETAGGDPARLRLPLGNLANRILGCAIFLPALGPATAAMAWLDPDPVRMAANFHTAFNLLLAALFLPFLPGIATLLRRVLPDRPAPADPATPRYLDPHAVSTPSVALANAAREVLRMTDVVDGMLRGSRAVFRVDDRAQVDAISKMDDVLDALYGKIQRYVGAVGRDGATAEELRRQTEILGFVINLEHIGDIIDKNLMELAAKRMRLHYGLPAEGLAEIEEMHDRLLENLQLAVAVFMSGDLASARRLVAEKDRFRDLERVATERHILHMRQSRSETAETGGLVLDIVRDLKRIEAHIAATAYPLLEREGVLRKTRLRG
jgi:phosphate:Na+ symporter